MFDFFTLLCTLPHIEPNALRQPSASGWPNIDAETMRTRGKTKEAIEFLRHLPCLVHDSARGKRERPNITPDSEAISFCDGETWPAFYEDLLETPSHVVWLAEAITRDGTYLLLDTINGSFPLCIFTSKA